MANLMDRSGFDGSRQPAPDFQSALNQAMQIAQSGVLDTWDCSDEPVDCYWVV